jgi:hypothetical protein
MRHSIISAEIAEYHLYEKKKKLKLLSAAIIFHSNDIFRAYEQIISFEIA